MLDDHTYFICRIKIWNWIQNCVKNNVDINELIGLRCAEIISSLIANKMNGFEMESFY